MAKSARSSRTKTNRAALRANVHGPAEAARAERLNAKLQELIAQPTAAQIEAEMIRRDAGDVDPMETEEVKQLADAAGDEMQVDVDENGVKPRLVKKSQRKTPSRVQKRRRSKPHAQITFPEYQRNGKKRVSAVNKKKGSRKSK